MFPLSALAVCMLAGAAQVHAEGFVIVTETTWSDVKVPTYVTETTTVLQTFTTAVITQLPVPTWTETYFESQPTLTQTFTALGDSTVTVTETSTSVVGGFAATVTFTPDPVTVWQSEGAQTTIFGGDGTADAVTSTVFDGRTTINKCVPTTTVVSTVTSPVPQPTAVAGDVVTYHKQKCNVVACPKGSAVASVNNVSRTCTLVYYGASVVSSTCTVDYCCAAAHTPGPVIINTNCVSHGCSCPGTSMILRDKYGAAVPCLQTWENNVITSTTCNQVVCCSAPRSTTTSTTPIATVTPEPAKARVSCRDTVRCAVYSKEVKTNYIRRCYPKDCTTNYCCAKL